jgi:hypothetical protein
MLHAPANNNSATNSQTMPERINKPQPEHKQMHTVLTSSRNFAPEMQLLRMQAAQGRQQGVAVTRLQGLHQALQAAHDFDR